MSHDHTPGPWYRANTTNHQGLVVSEATGANVAVTYDDKDTNLIAVAPELLEQLQRAHRFLRKNGYSMTEIDAVIAKAGG